MHSEGYSTWCVCVCVCVCVGGWVGRSVGRLVGLSVFRSVGLLLPSQATAKERYQQHRCNIAMDIKKTVFLKVLRSNVMAFNTSEKSQYANDFELTVDGFYSLPRSKRHGNW